MLILKYPQKVINEIYVHKMKNLDSKQILIAIAEDHALMREAISSELQNLGFKIVIEAANGQDLLEKLEQTDALPDICLLDINMPRLKGFQVAPLIRRQYPTIRIAALTANQDTDSLVKMLKAGATTYIVKSSDPEHCRDAINAVVEQGYFFTDWMAESVLGYFHKQ